MNILLEIYLMGYEGVCPPRWVRRLIAGSELHRAWLAGYMGVFYEDGLLRGGRALDEFWYRPLR